MANPTTAGDSILAQCYEHAIAFAEANVRFAERFASIPALNGSAKRPWYHQLRRLQTILATPRVLLADETGLGKTAVVVLAKLFEDLSASARAALLAETTTVPRGDRWLKPTARKTAIIFSTTSGMRDPWNDGEVNAFVPRAFPRQEVLHIATKRDRAHLEPRGGNDRPKDFIVVNYEKLLIPEVVRALAALITSGAVSLIALDECHQLRNPKAQRFTPDDTRALESGFLAILRAMRDAPALPKLLLLSATPIANTPMDLGVLIHLLDQSVDMQHVRTTRSLRVLRDLFWQGSTFRLDKQMAKELLDLPNLLEEEPVRVPLTDGEADAYVVAWEQLIAGGKFRALAAALFASKIRYLEEQVPRWRANGAQVVIFSSFRTGVTRELAERLGGSWIDGDITQQQRHARARAFREGTLPVLVATTKTSAESISLVTGDRPCVVVRFEPFFTPYEWVQTVGRVWRPGQHGEVRVVTLVAGGQNLAERLESACDRVEERYLLRRHKTWRPTSFDEDALVINAQKREAAEHLYAGHGVTKLMERILSVTSEAQLQTEMASLKFDSPSHRACFTARCWIGRGVDHARRVAATPQGERYAVDYNDHWEYTASAHTGELIRQIVEAYEQEDGPRSRVVDQGAGPGCSARALRRSMTAIDLSPKMLRLARQEVRRLNREEGIQLHLHTLQRTIQACGLPTRSMDLAIAAYVLQYARQDRHPIGVEGREIEQIILETNRILDDDGLWIIALPYNIEGAMIQRLEHVITAYGFEVLPLSGFYKPTRAQDPEGQMRQPRSSFAGAWLTIVRKRQSVSALLETPPQGLSFKPVALPGGVTKRGERRTWRRKRDTAERIVAFRHESGRTLDELIAASSNRSRTMRAA